MQHFSVLYPVLFGLNCEILDHLQGAQDAVHSHPALTATAECVAPSRDQACCSSRRTAGRQSNCADIGVECGCFGQFDEHDIVVQCVGIVARVADDFRCTDGLLAAVCACQVVFPKLHFNGTGKRKECHLLYCH